jgi:hypothetical protein
MSNVQAPETLTKLHRDPSLAIQMAANAVIRYLRESGIDGAEERRWWITQVFNSVMERELHARSDNPQQQQD